MGLKRQEKKQTPRIKNIKEKAQPDDKIIVLVSIKAAQKETSPLATDVTEKEEQNKIVVSILDIPIRTMSDSGILVKIYSQKSSSN